MPIGGKNSERDYESIAPELIKLKLCKCGQKLGRSVMKDLLTIRQQDIEARICVRNKEDVEIIEIVQREQARACTLMDSHQVSCLTFAGAGRPSA